ncbi:MAG: hypothetical protein HC886_14065 [Leptolyngbyaceae cyanobacterium SM1_1_3]|nr:hypothetical protein [Leptolyngbyaceae cyanobacterium SM1_1_3]NJN04490.1 hypothetical protein [Leptolyngbyaceae cyanobacterium RM1_1_2]NJO10667.1 hypothetical protein [Leptolyngbyaceae cyanobacterium SL_1_1]
MVQYTLAQTPDILIPVPGKDSKKNREKAMDQLVELMDEGKLPTALADGFGPQQFIEVKAPNSTAQLQHDEDTIVEAVQILSHLANLKVKVQDTRTEALKVHELVDLLFTDEVITDAQMTELKDGFKVLKTFAQNNLKYREARSQATAARQVLDAALKP